MPFTRFIEGPAGVARQPARSSTCATCSRRARGDEVLVCAAAALGWPYVRAFTDPAWPSGTSIDVITLGGLARRSLKTFWPLVAERAGFAQPGLDPLFLTIETAQYFMARLVLDAQRTGVFDSISISPFAIMRQTLDNLSKAAVSQIPLDEVADRLLAAWATATQAPASVSRLPGCGRQFREHCLHYSLLDFSLQIEVFTRTLLSEPLYVRYLRSRYRHLVADSLDEEFSAAGDFIRWLLPGLESALLLYDTDGGLRLFLGAASSEMRTLAELADEREEWREPVAAPPEMVSFAEALSSAVAPQAAPLTPAAAPLDQVLTVHFGALFPRWWIGVAENRGGWFRRGAAARDRGRSPFMSDSALLPHCALDEHALRCLAPPARALRESRKRVSCSPGCAGSSALGHRPPAQDVADRVALHRRACPVRACCGQIVYRPGS